MRVIRQIESDAWLRHHDDPERFTQFDFRSNRSDLRPAKPQLDALPFRLKIVVADQEFVTSLSDLSKIDVGDPKIVLVELLCLIDRVPLQSVEVHVDFEWQHGGDAVNSNHAKFTGSCCVKDPTVIQRLQTASLATVRIWQVDD